jgi:co-chaperonin GroES (HSP10)
MGYHLVLEDWMKRVLPIKDRIAVCFPDKPRESSGGIVLPEGAFESEGECLTGTIFAIGPEVKDVRLVQGVEVVYIAGRAAIIQNMRLDRHNYAVIDESDIQVILVDE